MNAYRREGKLVIEIDECALVSGAALIPSYREKDLCVYDREKYLDYLAANICTFGDDGDNNSCSRLTELLDEIVEQACEEDEGVSDGND